MLNFLIMSVDLKLIWMRLGLYFWNRLGYRAYYTFYEENYYILGSK